MTKKQIHQEINQLFFQYISENFPQYVGGSDEMGGRINFSLISGSGNDYFEYHKSRHTIICSNFANDIVKSNCIKIEIFLEDIIRAYGI